AGAEALLHRHGLAPRLRRRFPSGARGARARRGLCGRGCGVQGPLRGALSRSAGLGAYHRPRQPRLAHCERVLRSGGVAGGRRDRRRGAAGEGRGSVPDPRGTSVTARPRVAVVVTCYNLGRYLDEAMESVLGQTFRDFEIVIVDDGSDEPETVRLLERYARPQTRIVHSPNRGLSAARNLGILETTGEYICA